MNDIAGDGGNRAGRHFVTSAGPDGGSTPPARSNPTHRASGAVPPPHAPGERGGIPRFDAEARFDQLNDREKSWIGEWAVSLATSIMARGAIAMAHSGPRATPASALLLRVHSAAIEHLTAGPGFEAIADIAVRRAIDPAAVTTLLGRICRECGCSERDACHPSCSWAEEPADGLDGLCSTCAAGLEAEAVANYELPCAVKLPVAGGGEVTIRAGAKLSTLVEALRARDGQELVFGAGS